ncbi:hypothetical protein B0H19DRAFT_1246867 [Mycena capillaripes]|nr:hypothetical protein B0H19DRAFT_1246867 [Mycena capillaripes]
MSASQKTYKIPLILRLFPALFKNVSGRRDRSTITAPGRGLGTGSKPDQLEWSRTGAPRLPSVPLTERALSFPEPELMTPLRCRGRVLICFVPLARLPSVRTDHGPKVTVSPSLWRCGDPIGELPSFSCSDIFTDALFQPAYAFAPPAAQPVSSRVLRVRTGGLRVATLLVAGPQA